MITRIPKCAHRAYHTGKVGNVALQPSGKAAELLFTYERPSACLACERDLGPCYDPSPTVSASIDVDFAQDSDQLPKFDPSLADASAAFLRIDYGSGNAGVKHTVDVDLVHGTSVPLIAESASFYIVYPAAVFNPQLPIFQPVLRIAISVGEFSFGSTGPRAPQRTILVGRLTPGEGIFTSALIPIPKYAIAASLQTDDGLATAVLDQFSNAVGAPNVRLARTNLTKPEYESVRIAQGARGVTVTTTADSPRLGVIFYLGPA